MWVHHKISDITIILIIVILLLIIKRTTTMYHNYFFGINFPCILQLLYMFAKFLVTNFCFDCHALFCLTNLFGVQVRDLHGWSKECVYYHYSVFWIFYVCMWHVINLSSTHQSLYFILLNWNFIYCNQVKKKKLNIN